jgi:hypothetical protein
MMDRRLVLAGIGAGAVLASTTIAEAATASPRNGDADRS